MFHITEKSSKEMLKAWRPRIALGVTERQPAFKLIT